MIQSQKVMSKKVFYLPVTASKFIQASYLKTFFCKFDMQNIPLVHTPMGIHRIYLFTIINYHMNLHENNTNSIGAMKYSRKKCTKHVFTRRKFVLIE